MTTRVLLTTLTMLALWSVDAQAGALLPGDADNGGRLVKAQCSSCHGSEVYTRKDRRIKTLEGVIGQVHRCNGNLNAKLSRDQVNDIIKFLNESYYKYE